MTEFTEWRSLVDGETISAIPDSALYWNGELEDDWDVLFDEVEGTSSEKRDESLYLSAENETDTARIIFGTIDKIDLTDWDAIRFLSTGQNEEIARYGIGAEPDNPDQRLSDWDTQDFVEGGDFEGFDEWEDKEHNLDISDLSGEYHVGFTTEDATTDSANFSEVEVFEVELL